MFNFGFKKRDNLQATPFSPFLPAFLVFLALMVIIGMSWRTAKADINNQFNNSVNQNAVFVESTIRQRFGVYENSLRAANGLFMTSGVSTRSNWEKFVNSLQLSDRYPGIQALGYVTLVPKESKTALEESVRSEGIPSFTVFPVADRLTYAPLLYLVSFAKPENPERTIAALGFDMYSDPSRTEAMITSAKTGKAVLSDESELIRLKTEKKEKGFLMFFPHYTDSMPINTPAQRQAAIVGYIYAPFRSNGVFAAIFNTNFESFAFAVYQGEQNKRSQLYKSSSNYNNPEYVEAKQSDVMIYGQKWNIIYKAKSDIVPESVRSRPSAVFYAGTVFSFALAVIIYLLIQRRTRSLYYSEQRKLEEAKDDLLSLASHQLRTPATAVKQYVSMVKDGFAGEVDDEQHRLLQMAYDSNERQLTIVDDLLYVARIDAGKATLRKEKLNIAELIQSVINDQLLVIKGRKQTVKFRKPRVPVMTVGDPQYLRMIFENLLSNASKYSFEKTIINIILKELNDKIFIDFVDNGVGIAVKDYPSVFFKFSRIQNELTRQISGSGIGLYLAKQLAILHGGDITFVSEPKKGTTFTVQIPVQKK